MIRHSVPAMTPMPTIMPAADGVVRAVAGKGGDLEKGGVGVEHVGDALAHRQFASRAHPLHGPLATAGFGFVEQFVDDGELLEHVVTILSKRSDWVSSAEASGGASRHLLHGPILPIVSPRR